MTKTTKTDKTGANKIKKIDSTIYEAGIKHGLGVKDIGFVQDIIKGKTQTEAYKNNIAKPTTTDRKSIDAKASDKLRNGNIQDTLKDVLISNNITDDSIIKEHQNILALSKEKSQLSTARQCNEDFMKLNGMLDKHEKQEKGNTYIQNNIIDTQALDKLIKLKA